jgi:low affinity Fe/Cu permease
MRNAFRLFAHQTAEWVGTPQAFALAVALIVLWAATGPVFGFPHTWSSPS